MSKNPRFSVLIPVYNTAAYIQECLESVLNQTYSDYEIIIVDDGSTDDSVERIETITRNRSNCKIVLSDHGGVCKARNTAIACANGEYLCFVDADDRIFPDYLEKLEEGVKYGPDVIYFYVKYGVNSKPRKECPDVLYTLNGEELQTLAEASLYHTAVTNDSNGKFHDINSFSSGGQVYRKSLYLDNNIYYTEGITRSEDGLVNLQLLRYAKQGIIIGKQLYNYRTDNISATRSYKPDLIDVFKLRDNKVKEVIFRLYGDNKEKYLETFYCSLIYQIRVICQNCIFNPANKASFKEKRNIFFELIDTPDYSYAISNCGNSYLLEEDRKYLELAQLRSPERIAGNILKEKFRENLRKIVKNVLMKLKLYR